MKNKITENVYFNFWSEYIRNFREILKRKSRNSTLICFEKNSAFCSLLGKTIQGRNVFVVNDDVFNAANILSSKFEIKTGSVDCIISTLPCSSMQFGELLQKSV